MINIFYNPIYFKKKKVLLTKSLKHSIFLNYLININYYFNKPIHEKYIQSGPHKRINNLIISFRNDPEAKFNKNYFQNSYVVQYDKFGQDVVDQIINLRDENTKILIGPLYNLEQNIKLNKLTNKYSFIKKLVSSKQTYLNQSLKDSNFKSKNALICPSGVVSEKDLINNMSKTYRKNKCLIYFKKREVYELEMLTNFLDSKNQEYEVFYYGKYDNNKLKYAAKNYLFGITLSCSESQGFAIQEIMSCNLPLLVWDKTVNNYGGIDLPGSTVTIWDDRCGKIVNDFDSLVNSYDLFKSNLPKYSPGELVSESLTFEAYNKNLKNLFNF